MCRADSSEASELVRNACACVLSQSRGAVMSDGALDRLHQQLLAGWHEFARTDELDVLLMPALEAAAGAPPEILTVTSPVSKPARLRLAPLAERVNLDSFYGGEGAELCVSHDGQCYLVYRRSDGGDYCVLWSSATLMPESLMLSLPTCWRRRCSMATEGTADAQCRSMDAPHCGMAWPAGGRHGIRC